MDPEKVYFDVVDAVRSIISTDLKKVPNKPPPAGLGAKRVSAWKAKLSDVVTHLNKNGYPKLGLAKDDAKNTYDKPLQAAVLLLHMRIVGVKRISAKQLVPQAHLLNTLQAKSLMASARGRG